MGQIAALSEVSTLESSAAARKRAAHEITVDNTTAILQAGFMSAVLRIGIRTESK
jgi:hypothetical protein